MKRPADTSIDERIERAMRNLKTHEPLPHVWKQIESGLAHEDAGSPHPASMSFRSAFSLRDLFLPQSPWALAGYAVVILLGIAASVYILGGRKSVSTMETAGLRPSQELITDVQDDIDQAMYYYERAITRLEILASRNEKNLDPGYVALQREKINLLHSSISDCKAALHRNTRHPQVQNYLLTAYMELQTALQEMAGQPDRQNM